MIRWFTGITVSRLAKDRERIEQMRQLHAANVEAAIADRVAAIKLLQDEVIAIEGIR